MIADSNGIIWRKGMLNALKQRSAGRLFVQWFVFCMLVLGSVCAPVQAERPLPALYTVENGDTLWSIAARLWGDPLRWPELLVRNPQLIERGELVSGETLVISPQDEEAAVQFKVLAVEKRSPAIRIEAPARVPAVIPPDAITPFLSYPLLMDEVDPAAAGRVISGLDGDVLLGQFSVFFAQNLPTSATGLYTIFRPDRALTHPVSGEELGVTAQYLGTARLDEPGDVARLTIVSSVQEVSPGDRLISRQEVIGLPYLYPKVPQVAVDAHVVSTFGAISGVGLFSVVVVSAGSQDGLTPGDILMVVHPDRTLLLTRDIVRPAVSADRCALPTVAMNTVHTRLLGCAERLPGKRRLASGEAELIALPEGRSGELLVFRVFDRVSYALVRDVERAIQPNDRVVNPGT
ncbi:MAG: LysM peptidoglycan-binding domain-containing protein [Acidiferrobacteraceae bacterium]|nr:LysM peptidoglycan-binding domain-containing protein [Acidiferrobacteraceae bacterium]MBT5982104.1 LysM peptidoglycan-binding domain-containing protein [Acidiferrobacteraceae bacterium]MBT7353859.1 LysM peptidoglycan-binding domain-containing protein [Acidiferrobacteraceae bacterium]MBT7516819.1 LysM peptidoglycan-binding domain-containing protein [Acidiferrobacteraceae bacterium]